MSLRRHDVTRALGTLLFLAILLLAAAWDAARKLGARLRKSFKSP